MGNSPLVRERSRVQFSPAAPVSPYDYKAVLKDGESHVYAERRTNMRPYVARNWQDLPAYFGECTLYRYFDSDGALIYVGITGQIWHRDDQHLAKHWYSAARFLCVEAFPNRELAELAESLAILAEDPICNSQRRYFGARRIWWHQDYIAACGGCLRGYDWDAFVLPELPREPSGFMRNGTLYESMKASHEKDGRPKNELPDAA